MAGLQAGGGYEGPGTVAGPRGRDGVGDDGAEGDEERDAAGTAVVNFLIVLDTCTYMRTRRSRSMDVVSYSEARANLKDVMDRVVADKSEIIITRQKAEAVVMVSLSEWNSIVETAHLLSSPRRTPSGCARRSATSMPARVSSTS